MSSVPWCRHRPLISLVVIPFLAITVMADAHDYLKKSSDWFRSDEGRRRLANVLSYQDERGAWPKNKDTTKSRYRGSADELSGTFDNGATVGELKLLCSAYRATKNSEYRKSFMRGLDCILDVQYENGGWPQKPSASGYSRHITFNDAAMVRLMEFVRIVASDRRYDFVPSEKRKRAKLAFDRGIQCILRCQIRVDGQLTAWCAQHDAETFQPRPARAYEHPSISGGESAGIVGLLMSLENPSEEIKSSIDAAARWYRQVQLDGVRVEKKNGERKLVTANGARLWARFYEIGTNRPIFSGRDGVIKYQYSEIEAERRNGYAWYVNAGDAVASEYTKWRERQAVR